MEFNNNKLKSNKKLALSILIITIFITVLALVMFIKSELKNIIESSNDLENQWKKILKTFAFFSLSFNFKDFITILIVPFILAEFVLKIILVIRLERKKLNSKTAFILFIISFFIARDILTLIAAIFVLVEKYDDPEKVESKIDEIKNEEPQREQN